MQPRPATEAMNREEAHESEVKSEHRSATPVTPSHRLESHPGDPSVPAAERDQEVNQDEIIENDVSDGDADMDAVNEDESEEEVGIVHEDIEDEISAILLAQMGQSGRSYQRERAKSCRRPVSEIYSPPRGTKELKRSRYRKLAPGFALDLPVVDPDDGKPWDFNVEEKREKVRRMQKEQRPILLILSLIHISEPTRPY